MRRFPIRTRLTLALVGAAVIPVLLFGLLVLLFLDQSVAARQEDALRTIATLAAGQTGATLDEAAARRLADATGTGVALFSADGRLIAASSATARAVPPPPGSGTGVGATPSPTLGSGAVARAGGQVVAYAPIGGVGGPFVVAVSQPAAAGPALLAPLLAVLTVTLLLAMFLSLAFSRSLLRPLSLLTGTLDRLQAGDLSARMPVEADDELGRLAASHNRLADTLAARNRSLALVSQAVASLSPREGVAPLVATAERASVEAFGFTAVRVRLGPPDPTVVLEERVPGEAFAVRAPLVIGEERLGELEGTLPPTRDWGEADQDLLRIFGIQLAAAIRNAELFDATAHLTELKNEFLRGVSHNLQTPLTSIRAFATQLAGETGDSRLGIIVEQTERLSRLVAQLLTVSKIEAGTLKPQVDVFAVAPLVQRAWESLGRTDHAFRLEDQAAGWLAAADRDWVEQVVWALLDNALRYGGGEIDVAVAVEQAQATDRAVTVTRAPEPAPASFPLVVTTVRDHGQGIGPADRERVFERFMRLGGGQGEGSGLGLSVARGLVETMGGSLWLADTDGPGATFAFSLPAERIVES
ncbi:MAG: ATP-binding protein [Candidatus Limnocylindrales bacterium]